VKARRLPALAVFVLAAAVAGLAACDEAEVVAVQNKTEQTLVVYEDGVATELVNPGAIREFGIKEFRGTLSYEVRYFCGADVCDQSVLASRTFTWEELTRTGGITLGVQ
jgi:hypothetical protein